MDRSWSFVVLTAVLAFGVGCGDSDGVDVGMGGAGQVAPAGATTLPDGALASTQDGGLAGGELDGSFAADDGGVDAPEVGTDAGPLELPDGGMAVGGGTDLADAFNYERSFKAGVMDKNGKLLRGTEIMHLVGHKGKLYAANSLWMESSPSTSKAAQIFVLDSPTGKWRLDRGFAAGNLRMSSLKQVTFATDADGDPITPVKMLLAAPDVFSGEVKIFSRNDAQDSWKAMVLGSVGDYTTTRAIGLHRDSVSGVDTVFAGVSGDRDSGPSLGMLTGVYDDTVTGRIRWKKKSELKIPTGERVMGFATANGVLYVATSRRIYRRTDGASPSWKQVHYNPDETAPVGIRGLTAIEDPNGEGEVLIFVARSKIRRIDPANDHEETVELDVPEFLSEALGLPITWVLAAYNQFMSYPIVGTDETVWMVGFESIYPKAFVEAEPPPDVPVFVRDAKSPKLYFASEARYLVRHVSPDGVRYEVSEVKGPTKPPRVAPRAFAVSPFADDEEGALYFGGFDCNSQPSHNTAWIDRGTLK